MTKKYIDILKENKTKVILYISIFIVYFLLYIFSSFGKIDMPLNNFLWLCILILFAFLLINHFNLH